MNLLAVSKDVLLLELGFNRKGDKLPHPLNRSLRRKPEQVLRQASRENPRAAYTGVAVDGNILAIPNQRRNLIN